MRTRAFPVALLAAACAFGAAPSSARAQEEGDADAGGGAETISDPWTEDLVLTTGRVRFPEPDPRGVNLGLHGEYQLRVLGATDLRLDPPIRERTPEAAELGQNVRVEHWLRLRGRFDFEDHLSVVVEADLPRGFVAGDDTRYVTAARDPFDDPAPITLYGRQLYLQANTPIGVFRAGHQTSGWGMGLVANDGDTPQMFGDYRRGDIVERLLFATKPAGRDHPFVIAIAGDLVFEDDTADLVDGPDRAMQGVLALAWRDDSFDLGVYGVVRHHERDRTAAFPSPAFTESLTVGVVDVAGGFHADVPGAQGIVYGQAEGALVVGETDFVRTNWIGEVDPGVARNLKEDVVQMGGAVKLGFVHLSHPASDTTLPNGAILPPPGGGGPAWGDVVAEVELGWASGDADPGDGTSKRFVFDANHNVGLVLFDHVLAWKSARAATNAQDPRIVGRAPPGIDLLPSDGGVFGATYLNPRVIGRPERWWDLKLGVVVAQATSDVVDPYRFGALGSARNWDGGDPEARDLGVELDAGTEVRIPVGREVVAQLGAEGGVLFPGGAFDDAVGNRLPVQALGQARVGLQF